MAKSEGISSLSSSKAVKDIRSARRRAAASLREHPIATDVMYEAKADRIVVTLSNGCTLSIPSRMVRELRSASRAEIANVAVSAVGTSLRWEKLDLDLGVTALVSGVLGTRAWMKELARLGGKATSPQKAAAARANGRKGGRPRAS